MFNKILIANRGEIAVRIIRACRNLGIRSVAVYSKEDAKSLHVQLADQRICIGEGPARNSYLNMDRIIAAAENMGADAIHPGFGFLSENSEFVRKCKENGITFIGPDADVIDKMGNKSHARKTIIDEETRRKMNEYAVLAAKTVGYTNAGTIEFIVDPKGNFYFMEMNTRIQVEHGVTEMVTGTDLIIEQIRVAMGEELSFKQEDIRIKGHAIECRINAEIPEKNFMPSPGVVQHMHLPAGNGVRVDTALYTGYKIPSEYDSMIAKVIVHAPDREAALQKMRSALDEMVVMGVETNLDFQYQIMKNQVFCDGKADTGFIENVLKIKG